MGSDQYAYWRRALANKAEKKKTPMTEEPQHGFYRWRQRIEYRVYGPWLPIAIFTDPDRDEMICIRDGVQMNDVYDIWMWCCQNPITHEDYTHYDNTGEWQEE